MRFKLIKFFLIIVSSSMISSCIVYHVQSVDIPLIKEKNEIKIDGGVSLLPSANMTVSYGLTDKFALQGYGNFDIGSDEYYYFQGAAGYFKKLNDKNVIELYGGFGSGYGSAYSDASGGHLAGGFNLFFTQINFGKISTKSSNTEYGIGIKTGLLHSSLTDKNYYDYLNSGSYQRYIDNSFLIEPDLFVRLGGERLKFNIKLGTCWMYKFTNQTKNFPYFPFNFGLSLNYKI